jgi:hypothetical protein
MQHEPDVREILRVLFGTIELALLPDESLLPFLLVILHVPQPEEI